ncbi:MAG: hypothetical protein ACPGJS_16950 [Flammeovirgaceae bacterium]
MDSKEIRQLLEKYWACEASLEEEQQLNTYFNGTDIAPELVEYQALFNYLDQQKTLETSARFDEQLKWKIANHNRSKTKPKLVLNFMRVAASLLIILTFSYVYYNHHQHKQQTTAILEDTYQDPEIAYQEMKKALLEVSQRMNSGTKYMVSIKQINEGTKYFKTDKKIER